MYTVSYRVSMRSASGTAGAEPARAAPIASAAALAAASSPSTAGSGIAMEVSETPTQEYKRR